MIGDWRDLTSKREIIRMNSGGTWRREWLPLIEEMLEAEGET
jgi:hypothetical protein